MLATIRSIAAALVIFLQTTNAIARPDGVFDVGSVKPAHAFITSHDIAPSSPRDGEYDSPMLRHLAGIIAELDARQLSLLAQTVIPGSKMLDARGTLFRVGIVHLSPRSGPERKRVELLLSPDGVLLAQELDDGQGRPTTTGRVVKLDPDKFRPLSIDWARYRGAFSDALPGFASRPDAATGGAGPADLPAPASAAPIEPLLPSPFFLDQELLGDRFLSGRRSNIPPAARLLSKERMILRTPRAYTPRRPAGLLVWINAAPVGDPPAVFSQALDELNIACVGIVNVGNDRPVADRYQLALDAVFTVSARIHVDPRRVYVTGISGGGRVSSMLLACFPDYFTGAVPIVGLSCYEKVPLGNSRYAPPGFSRPRDARFSLLKTRRIGAITGDQDFNQPEMTSAATIMKGDGLSVRIFEYEKFGHQMPSAAQFLDVLKWVDEPYQALVQRESQAAASLLERYVKKHGEVAPPSPAARAELIKVTSTGPWTEAAWRAADWLLDTAIDQGNETRK